MKCITEESVIGWSQDEEKIAVRQYRLEVPEPSAECPPVKNDFCEGYVDHKGKRFRGGLSILVLKVGEFAWGESYCEKAGDPPSMLLKAGTANVVASYLIQDAGACTPAAEAVAHLNEAKKGMQEMGIVLNSAGARTEPQAGILPRVVPKGSPSSADPYEHSLKVNVGSYDVSFSYRGIQRVEVDDELCGSPGAVQALGLQGIAISKPSDPRSLEVPIWYGLSRSPGPSGYATLAAVDASPSKERLLITTKAVSARYNLPLYVSTSDRIVVAFNKPGTSTKGVRLEGCWPR